MENAQRLIRFGAGHGPRGPLIQALPCRSLERQDCRFRCRSRRIQMPNVCWRRGPWFLCFSCCCSHFCAHIQKSGSRCHKGVHTPEGSQRPCLQAQGRGPSTDEQTTCGMHTVGTCQNEERNLSCATTGTALEDTVLRERIHDRRTLPHGTLA